MSLWNILRNNIGKDLSKVSMPVQLNEPLNTLQRLCEELEYSSLLDQASHLADPCERMVNCSSPGSPLEPCTCFYLLFLGGGTWPCSLVPLLASAGVCGRLRCISLLIHLSPGGLQTLQPCTRRDL